MTGGCGDRHQPTQTTPGLGRCALLSGAAAVAGIAALAPLDALTARSAQAAGGAGMRRPHIPEGPGASTR